MLPSNKSKLEIKKREKPLAHACTKTNYFAGLVPQTVTEALFAVIEKPKVSSG
jgi:hypothetical protein